MIWKALAHLFKEVRLLSQLLSHIWDAATVIQVLMVRSKISVASFVITNVCLIFEYFIKFSKLSVCYRKCFFILFFLGICLVKVFQSSILLAVE